MAMPTLSTLVINFIENTVKASDLETFLAPGSGNIG